MEEFKSSKQNIFNLLQIKVILDPNSLPSKVKSFEVKVFHAYGEHMHASYILFLRPSVLCVKDPDLWFFASRLWSEWIWKPKGIQAT